MKKYIIIAAFAVLALSQNAYCQQPSYMSVQYSVGFGSGDLADYISAPSFRGALIEYRSAIKDNLLVGFDLGWNVFYERKDYDSYTSGTETLSGIQYRTQNELPMLLAAEYLFLYDQPLKPYVGLGIGTMYTERNTEMGTWRIEENPWHFAIKPEIGILYEMSYSTSFKLAAKYYSGFKSGDLDANQSYISISAGLAFNL
ncbi:MAG: outer membrane beta-barrel protein [Cyclobacteriaceae bacterium]|nr:outer membrane beta-barrel protein [Cyclobacteriaceae bacterium]